MTDRPAIFAPDLSKMTFFALIFPPFVLFFCTNFLKQYSISEVYPPFSVKRRELNLSLAFPLDRACPWLFTGNEKKHCDFCQTLRHSDPSASLPVPN